jgi:protoporphyrinogen/coproporphyrinogen III oxidase
MEQVDVLIIGAGISGLTFGHYCKQRNLSNILLEKTDRLGGLIESTQFQNNFWVESGAHTCFNTYGNLLNIMEELALLSSIQPRATKKFQLYKNQQVKSIASQLHFFELFLHVFNQFITTKQGKTVKEYYQPLVGENNYRDVFQHAFNAVICQNAQEFPAELLFRKKLKRKTAHRSFIFPNGIQTLPNTIAQHLDCRFEQQIQHIDFNEDLFEVKTNANTFQSKYLVIATPVEASAMLLEKPFPTISSALKQIPLSTAESFAVKVPKEIIKLKPFAGLVGVEEDFYSVVSRDTLPNEQFRGFTFHFKAGRLSEEEKLQKVAKILDISEEQILEKSIKINKLPALKLEHGEIIEKTNKLLENQRLAISGNYWNGVSLEDCASRSLAEFNRLFG